MHCLLWDSRPPDGVMLVSIGLIQPARNFIASYGPGWLEVETLYPETKEGSSWRWEEGALALLAYWSDFLAG